MDKKKIHAVTALGFLGCGGFGVFLFCFDFLLKTTPNYAA